MQARISATINPEIEAFAQRFSKKNHITLSQVLEKSLELLQKKYLQEQLKLGYLADKSEAIDWANLSIKITDLNDEL